ncbi:hypothetical protein [Cryptosporangium japonicum]|uniref:Cysteinyl-tRNA synthetase-like protein n=1 Tax=Cryptosporangium japonicum TaxID=80872 RepID=A0ABP3ESF8_9ACTN
MIDGILALMGSGETSPTMVTVHRDLVARLGVRGPRAVLVETPYGFQENVAEISRKAQRYFAQSVGLEVTVAPGLRGGSPVDPAANTGADEGLALVRSADWVFSGPGSPTYALKTWLPGSIGSALRDRVRAGRGVTLLASAAAATAGRVTVPVYELYKAGATPHWAEGLDLTSGLGLRVAVIPHFDNTEGGTHDTRFCYLGERRLRALEQQLPDDAAVLGIDEHTAVFINQSTAVVEIVGRGGLTIRRSGSGTVLPSGTTLTIEDLRALTCGVPSTAVATAPPPPRVELDLVELTAACERRFDEAVGTRDAPGMVRAVLDLEQAIRDWAEDTEEDEGTEKSRAVLRTLIVRLGEVAAVAVDDPRERLAPIVEPLVVLRGQLRSTRAYSAADTIRAALGAGGVRLEDSDEGTRWLVG